MGSIPWGALSAQSFAGWSLESEALLPEWSTWLLICTCVGTWVGPGASVHGEGGGEGWHPSLCEVGWWRAWWAGLPSLSPHREGFGGKGAGRVLRDLPGLHSRPCAGAQSPSPPSRARDAFSWHHSRGTALSECQLPGPNPARRQPRGAPSHHCSQGSRLDLSPASTTTS